MTTPPQDRTKPKPWDQMRDEERAKIIKDLEDGGFGSELQARSIFQKEGFHVRSFYFHDLDDDRTREVDVRAFRRIDNFTPGGQVSHMVVAEVKSGYIWVLGDEDVDDDFDVSNIVVQSVPPWFRAARGARVQDPQWEALSSCVYGDNLKARGITASIHQKKSGKTNDAWYEAASKVYKVATTYKTLESSRDTDFFLSIPLVVLDGNLLAARLCPEGQLTLEPREHAQVLFSFASDHYRQIEISIHVVTLTGLPAFLKRVFQDGREGSEIGKQIYRSLSDKEKRPPPTVST